MYTVRTPRIVQALYGDLHWHMPRDKKCVYLTFDDGPTPGVTDWVLDTLAAHKAKATFFCTGKNIESNPPLFERISAEGHSVGNHTYDHLNGWKSNDVDYLKNVDQCQSLTNTKLFRPPYGRISRSQIRALKDRYRIIMWDVLSGDFDRSISNEDCLKNVRDHIMPGSIVVFHDSVKASEKLRFTLEPILDHLQKEGYSMESL